MENIQEITRAQFEELFKNHYQELCAYANHIIHDLEEAEEVVQSLFVKLWENRNTTSIQKSIRVYLFSATKNACYNQQKHLKIKETYKTHNQREIDALSARSDNDYEASELDETIQSAINKLPEGRRRIFILSRYEGLKYKEIAEKLTISVKTVENQMSSAIKALKLDLAEYISFIGFLIIGMQNYF